TDVYRDTEVALKLRADELRSELRDHELRASEAKNELSKVEATLVSRARIRRLHVLDDVRIASPCDARWSEMVGDEKVRFCTACGKNVYQVSKMTREEAEARLAEDETPCMRLHRRADGTVITADCPVGDRRMRRWRRFAMTGGALAAAVGTLGAL